MKEVYKNIILVSIPLVISIIGIGVYIKMNPKIIDNEIVVIDSDIVDMVEKYKTTSLELKTLCDEFNKNKEDIKFNTNKVYLDIKNMHTEIRVIADLYNIQSKETELSNDYPSVIKFCTLRDYFEISHDEILSKSLIY